MLSWWWLLPLTVAAGGSAALSALAGRIRREAELVRESAAKVQVAAGRGSRPAGPG